MYVCMYVCMPVCMYVCMYVLSRPIDVRCMYMYVWMDYVCMYAKNGYVCMYVCMYLCVCMYVLRSIEYDLSVILSMDFVRGGGQGG